MDFLGKLTTGLLTFSSISSGSVAGSVIVVLAGEVAAGSDGAVFDSSSDDEPARLNGKSKVGEEKRVVKTLGFFFRLGVRRVSWHLLHFGVAGGSVIA